MNQIPSNTPFNPGAKTNPAATQPSAEAPASNAMKAGEAPADADSDKGAGHEFKEYRAHRHADVPLDFAGYVLGEAIHQDRNAGQYGRVTIWVTKSGNYIVERCYDNSALEFPFKDASKSKNPAALINWLRDDDGRLSELALRALTDAADNDDNFEKAFVEVIP